MPTRPRARDLPLKNPISKPPRGSKPPVAVLLITFKRPSETEKVLDRILEFKPERLYIASDGPPGVSDIDERVAETRELVKAMCARSGINSKFRFSKTHLGCRNGVTTAIDWFFEHEEEGIILEDDTLPSQSFFLFCNELLDRFRNDQRVMKIAGFNLISESFKFPGDYFFSHVSFSWGWATWKRAWKFNDPDILHWNYAQQLGLATFPLLDRNTRKRVEQASRGLDTWDYQWDFAIASQNGLHVVPRANLIQNIGFGAQATHTVFDSSSRGSHPAADLGFPLNHGPGLVMPNLSYQHLLRSRQFRDRLKALVFRIGRGILQTFQLRKKEAY